MKLTKIIMTALIALSLGFGSTAMAGDGHHHKRGHHRDGKHAKWTQMSEQEKLEHMQKRLDRRVERLDKKLELTDAQEKQVRQILESSRTEFMDIRQRNEGDREARHKEMRALKERTKAELAKVLTAEQQEEFKELRKKRRHKRGRKH